MQLKEILTKRRSIRKFNDKAISPETIEELLELTLAAPSSRNSRSSRFMVISGEENLAHIAAMRDYGSAFVKGAKAAILILGDRSVTDLWQVNCSISATIMQLACVELGLSSCWVHIEGRPHLKDEPTGLSAEEHLRQRFDIPENYSALCAIAIGYSDFEPAPLPEFDASGVVKFLESV